MTEAEARTKRSADDTGPLPASLLGLVTIVGGAATGLFSDLRSLGKLIGFLAFIAWVVALGLVLWGPHAWKARAAGSAGSRSS
jgi:hypothetical protein